MSSAEEFDILTDDEQDAIAIHRSSDDEFDADWDPEASYVDKEDESDDIECDDSREVDDESSDESTHSFFRPRRIVRRSSCNEKKVGGKRKTKQSEGSERRNRRRKIADVMDDKDLELNTRKAREEEAKRAKRIDAILGSFSNLSEDQLAVPHEKAKLLVLNPTLTDGTLPTGKEGTEDAPIFVYKDIVDKLKPHQIIGARFLWGHVAEEPQGFGCVLADFMGLGKSLQVITTVQAFLTKTTLDSCGNLRQRHKHVLILAPTICVRNWEAEVVKWLGKKETRRLGLFTLESSREKKIVDRLNVVKQWHRCGGLLITGYELYRLLVLQSSGEEKISTSNQKVAHMIKKIYKCFCDPGPDLIVLDEGHRVRNYKSKLVKALAHVKTTRRIILTGYPLQNHLEEYWTMVNFARPNYLGSLDEFKNRFVAPIKNGQCIDSSAADLRLARRRAFILSQELKSLVLRRDQRYLFEQLPPKKEYVLMCKLTDAQAQLYREFLIHGVPVRGGPDTVDVLGGYHIALAISNHPDVIFETYNRLEEEERIESSKKKNRRAVSNLFNEDGVDGSDPYDDVLMLEPHHRGTGPLAKVFSPPRINNVDDDDDNQGKARALDAPSTVPRVKKEHRLKFARKFMEKYVPHQLEASGKMMILMNLLSACQNIGDRVILFTQSISTLDTIGSMISKHNRYQRRRAKRLHYLRIDGSTTQQDRFRQIAQFNDLDEDIDLIMISTKAGGEGINLCAGNRIVIFDVCWNPCNDAQSMCRSYRFGQTKPVFVYRFVTMGTMEKKVYDLQIRKEGVAKRIVDEMTTERRYMTSELQQYFSVNDFEKSLVHAQGLVADKEYKAIPQEDDVLRSILSELWHQDSTAIVPDSKVGKTTSTGMIADRRCIIDWFEQDTMFEEDLDQQCSLAEQREVLETHEYFKAVRKLREGGIHRISREGLLLKSCDRCHALNEIYPSSTTNVPVPSSIECNFCKQPVPTSGAVPPSQLPAYTYSGMQRIPGFLMPLSGSFPSSTYAYVSAGSDPARTLVPGVISADPTAARFGGNQNRFEQLSHHSTGRNLNQWLGELAHRQNNIQTNMPQQDRVSMKLSDRHLLVLRRGIKGCQDLRRKAEKCGATLAIEVDSQLTDIVSAMDKAETLKWLKLNKLPQDVELHDEAWLRNEIAKESGVHLLDVKSSANIISTEGADTALNAGDSCTRTLISATTAVNGEVSVGSNSDCIELTDSDDETRFRPASNHQPAESKRAVSVPDEGEVIEIL
ncbi:transcriptional regulator atrx [Plasmopara halstedii]|uniref:Transcriptional regulator atrx n=1 Tax=Plasmopara halstedii TaxID=4781 RepID=A0A0P1B0H8_PLAHL|nr:transcriptional regulator atrx [Plasmopara halstedii]CEG47162.1 transcriptional regulator atrx [Plasmopara halstedii]|eukprot:XP_024583531.1 transcriptional regulator atrx [Plasmopara halstedii]